MSKARESEIDESTEKEKIKGRFLATGWETIDIQENTYQNLKKNKHNNTEKKAEEQSWENYHITYIGN